MFSKRWRLLDATIVSKSKDKTENSKIVKIKQINKLKII